MYPNRTVLREMIQNAADANATKVTIKFETLPSATIPMPASTDQTALLKHTISNHTLKRLLVSNNGLPFSEKDWARLKRIADGNPDETKIGAFGVGFYSVFDDCEEPFVSSGKEAMAFYWKGNALFTRRLQLAEKPNPETTFVLDSRNDTSPVPSLMELCQFLSTSLTFVSLENIELWLDDWNLLRLTKKRAPSVSLSIPRDIDTKTPQGLMKINDVTREVAQIDASWMRIIEWNPNASIFRLDGLRDTTGSLRSFFSKLTGQGNAEKEKQATEKRNSVDDSEDMSKILNASVFLHINTASIQSSVGHSLSSELERATRKPPPKKTSIAVLTPSYDTSMASGAATSRSDFLTSVLPSKAGRVFIGFPTQQTTGLNAHISAPSVIPTVERESIDLNTRYISKWNTEMLRAAGIVCRIAWAAEMASIKSKLSSIAEKSQSSKIRKGDVVHVLPEAVHTANQFVFRESTPSPVLGQTLEDAFWTCNRKASIEVLSTCGIIQTHQARIAPKDLSFMDNIPVLPDEFVTGAKDFVRKLTDFGLITDITVSDIKRELEASTLQSKQVVEFLSWLSRKAASGYLDAYSVGSLLNVAVANDEDDSGNITQLLVFDNITSYLNPQRIPADLPLPPFVLPFKYTKSLPKSDLDALGWTELQIIPWIRWLITNSGNRNALPVEKDITQTPSFAAQVLPVLSKQFDSLSPSSKQTLIGVLQSHTVMPTRLGMKYPIQTYFPSVRLFDDLPIVHGLYGVKEKFLATLGVRKTVELSVIFERLLNGTDTAEGNSGSRPKWSHVDLIRYLASVREDIPSNDIQKLKNTSICTAESIGDSEKSSSKRYKISDLFEPKDSLRDLGFPVIEWPGHYEPSSKEGSFLTMMGLRRFPSAPELVQLMVRANSKGNRSLHGKTLSYYISEYHTNNYATFDAGAVDASFLPVEGSDELRPPRKCFTDDGANLFNMKILRRDLHSHASKLGVKQHPPVTNCLDYLTRRPPIAKRDARVLFKYLAGRVTEISARDIDRVGQSLIVPVVTNSTAEKVEKVRHVAPSLCYLGEGDDYKDIFDFVDFGNEANLFLMAMGSKREPTKPELAQILVREPARISSTFQSAERYLKLLGSLSESLMALKRDKELFGEMKRAPFLLASRDISSLAQNKTSKEKPVESDDEEYDEDQSIKEWTLASAKDVVVVDDFQSFNLFKEHILAAPQEEALENFYLALGAIPLSTIVEERASWGSVAADQRLGAKLQRLINERSRLFLHDQSPDAIRHDTKWLEKNLQVQVVNSISLTRSLKGRRVSLTQKRSAVITQQQSRAWTLWICPGKYDYYEISQALVHLVLYRPKLHTTLTLEMLLKTDLLELKTRGYNVERILKQKAQEARVAEDKRQKQLEEERRQLQEREAAWARERAQLDRQVEEDDNSQALMPGDFPDSPTNRNDRHVSRPQMPEPAPEHAPEKPRSLFANFTRRLGLDSGRPNSTQELSQPQPQPSEHSGQDAPPPPYSPEDPKTSRPEQPMTVNPPHKLHSELLSAVQACRPHGSSGVYSRPETSQVTETKSYCDEKPSHDLDFIATLPCGINLLFVKSLGDRSNFIAKNGTGINMFASVLMECASVFALGINTLSVFYDPGGKTIAFNRAGSIFCNYFYFQQLHEAGLLQSQDSTEALVYWWVILCHELAHNLVGDHSSAHSYYRYDHDHFSPLSLFPFLLYRC